MAETGILPVGTKDARFLSPVFPAGIIMLFMTIERAEIWLRPLK